MTTIASGPGADLKAPGRRIRRRYAFRLPLAPRFVDMVGLGHVHSAALGAFYEEARVAFHRSLFPQASFTALPDPRFLLVAMNTVYLAEVLYPAPLETRCAVIAVGAKSHGLGLALFQEGRCVGLADQTFVYVVDGTATAMSPPIIETLRSAAFRQRGT